MLSQSGRAGRRRGRRTWNWKDASQSRTDSVETTAHRSAKTNQKRMGPKLDFGTGKYSGHIMGAVENRVSNTFARHKPYLNTFRDGKR